MFVCLSVKERLPQRRSRTHPTGLIHAVGRPTSHIFENDGLLVLGCMVEFASTETRSTKGKNAEKLVVINGLVIDVISRCLEDKDAERVGIQSQSKVSSPFHSFSLSFGLDKTLTCKRCQPRVLTRRESS